MKRFHVHVGVDDLQQGIDFYSAMFGTAPAVTHPDYAKWMLEDPRVNFAISTGRERTGLAHLGLQTDSDDELETLHGQLRDAQVSTASEHEVSCCYARSNKYWARDPAGIAWETFHTLQTEPSTHACATTATKGGCRAPASSAKPAARAVAGCCA